MNKLGGLRAVVSLLGFMLLPALWSMDARGEGTRITTEQVNEAIQQMQKLAEKEIAQAAVPGLAIAVVFQDQVVYAAGFGVRDVNTREPVNVDTVFQLASLSKPIGSTVMAELVSEGKISWDSRISDLDPDFAMYDPWVTRQITIRDFYAHRSGLPDHAGDLLEDLGFTREEILHRLRHQKPDSSFRSHYAYTNFGITEAAVAATKAYNIAWEDATEAKLFGPLGMNSTSSRYADFVARTNKAPGHVQENGTWTQKYKRDPDTESPAGGVSSSVNDLAKWMRLELADGQFDGKQIVDGKALATARSPQIRKGFSPLNGLPEFYGLGWDIKYDKEGRLRLSHSGAFALGAATTVQLIPSEHLGVVVLTNAYPIGLAEGLAFTFTDVALYGKATQDWFALFKEVFSDPAAPGVSLGTDYLKSPASPTPALATSAYVGTYTNDFFGDIQIIEEGDRLAIVEGPHKSTFRLQHYDRDIFTYKSEGENATLAAGVIFTIGADGKAATVTVENLNVRGEGIFKRVSGVPGSSKATPPDAATREFAGPVDIGNGRKIYLECRGAGSPTVIFESGYRNDADIWSAEIEPASVTVLPEVAKFTHVCAYDRPGTLLDADHLGRSDQIEMPRAAQDLVADLHMLLQKAHIPGPYVIVAHSFGGIFARLYASTYPDEVVGMVLVDALSENVRSGLTPEQWKLYVNFGFKQPPPGLEKYKEIETLDVDTSFDQMQKAKRARPLRRIPLAVLTQGQPFDLSPWQPLPADFPAALDKAWHAAQDAQAMLVSGSKHIIATKSSHYIQIQQPELVIDAIRDVVNAVRDPSSW
jgi:CubicO group peptidase (beta-lactamase class C family)/pimeloyl-ACP methyl ester carboxylesterase